MSVVRRSAGKKKSLTRRLVERKNGGTLCLHSQALHSTEFYYFKPVIRTRFAKHAMDMVPHGLLGELNLAERAGRLVQSRDVMSGDSVLTFYERASRRP